MPCAQQQSQTAPLPAWHRLLLRLQDSPHLGGLSGSLITLDKLRDPMDSMANQPGCYLQTSASIEGFLQLTSSLELSGAKPFPDGLQAPVSFWMDTWPAGSGQAPQSHVDPALWTPVPNPDDACTLPVTPTRVFDQNSLKTAVKYSTCARCYIHSRHLWAPTLDQGWGPRGGSDPAWL